eukprot:3505850-Alexandrium_andersonii.AAC.1
MLGEDAAGRGGQAEECQFWLLAAWRGQLGTARCPGEETVGSELRRRGQISHTWGNGGWF